MYRRCKSPVFARFFCVGEGEKFVGGWKEESEGGGADGSNFHLSAAPSPVYEPAGFACGGS